MRRSTIIFAMIIGMGIPAFTGCGSAHVSNHAKTGEISETEIAADNMTDADAAKPDTAAAAVKPESDTAALSGENGEKAEADAKDEKQEQSEAVNETGDSPKEAPQLPETGRQLADFVPEGWEVWDSVELDFNEDGIPDYAVVLQAVSPNEDGYLEYRLDYPRILFAIASDVKEGYCLDFQEENVIRKRDEGGVFGDPYQPLTAEGTVFTTHAYGGSAWRWSEDYTYTYREGTWWLTSSEETYGYGDYITDYEKNDWESGVGIRKERSSDWDSMEEDFEQIENGDWDLIAYDLEYEVPLDGRMTLEQVGKRRQQDKELSELAQKESDIDYPQFYDGKIYYTSEIVENVTYRTAKDGKEQITEEEDTVGMRLNRMEPDGSGKEIIFEYRYLETIPDIMENSIPYISMLYEISGGEIIAEVYLGGEPHPFYRMKTDGSGQEKIGQVPE